MKRVLGVLAALVILVLVLFVWQNMGRLPMQDAQGGYLSIDLYFVGFQLTKPLAMPWIMGICFLVGFISWPILGACFSSGNRI